LHRRWGIISLIVYDGTIVMKEKFKWEYPYNVYHYTAFAISISIAVGVWGLSAMQCTMLAEAAAEYGAAGYIIGNFAVHYYPVIRILGTSAKDIAKTKDRTQTVAAFILFLTYLHINNANTVYGCPVAENVIIVAATAGIVLTYAIEVAAKNQLRAHQC
jgi:hypothetical protein